MNPPSPKPSPLSRLSAVHFGRKIGTGFAATVLLAILITVVSIYALRSVSSANDLAAFSHAQDLFDAEKLHTVAQQKVAIARGFLLTRDGLFVADARMADAEFKSVFNRLQQHAVAETDRKSLNRLTQAGQLHEASLQRAYRLAKKKSSRRSLLIRFFNEDTMPKFDAWERELAAYTKIKEIQMEQARQDARKAAARALRLIVLIALGALTLAMTLAFVLTRTLTRIYEKMRIAVRAREDVLAIVSHDLKNPLASVMLNADMLVKHPELPPEMQKRIGRSVRTSAQQMRQLIDDLLDFVKLEFGKLKVSKKLEDPQLIANDAIAVFAPLAQEKRISLVRSVEKNLTILECERVRILQVISNLLGNAIKFTPEGGNVSLNLTTVGMETLIWVRDTGPGIPTEQLSRVFDRYWQGQQKEHQGVGLGLAIAKGIVEAHGGRIWAESQPGEGCAFYFTLPNPNFKSGTDTHHVVEGLKTALLRFPGRPRSRIPQEAD